MGNFKASRRLRKAETDQIPVSTSVGEEAAGSSWGQKLLLWKARKRFA